MPDAPAPMLDGLRLDASSRDTLADRAYRSIRMAIINKDLVPDRYYSEAWLARILGISRTPTHSALLQLEVEGLVEIFAQRGFRLRHVSEAEYIEFYDVRILLETNVLRRLAPVVTPEQVAKLREFLEGQWRVVEDASAFQDLDEEFHCFMAEAAGLKRTAAIIHSLRGILWLGTSHRPVERREAVTRQHTAIVDTLEAHDPDAAVRALEHHLRSSQEWYRKHASAAAAVP